MLKQGLEELGFSAELIERVLPKLNSYINELELFNSAYDLVGADTHQDIVVRHILDSLAPYSHLQNLISQAKQNSTEQIEIADVGTGGGLPGIPLAIVFDDDLSRGGTMDVLVQYALPHLQPRKRGRSA